MKCQILYSEKIRNLSSVCSLLNMPKVKATQLLCSFTVPLPFVALLLTVNEFFAITSPVYREK